MIGIIKKINISYFRNSFRRRINNPIADIKFSPVTGEIDVMRIDPKSAYWYKNSKENFQLRISRAVKISKIIDVNG